MINEVNKRGQTGGVRGSRDSCAKSIHTLLGDMPVKFIGNYFVTFVYRYQVLGFIGNYAVCELPIKFIGKCFTTAI